APRRPPIRPAGIRPAARPPYRARLLGVSAGARAPRCPRLTDRRAAPAHPLRQPPAVPGEGLTGTGERRLLEPDHRGALLPPPAAARRPPRPFRRPGPRPPRPGRGPVVAVPRAGGAPRQLDRRADRPVRRRDDRRWAGGGGRQGQPDAARPDAPH